MAQYLHDRMQKRVRAASWMLGVAAVFAMWLAAVGTIIYVAYHFVTKFW